MTDKMEVLLEQIDKKIKNNKKICTSKLVKHCKSEGIEIPKLYMELHRRGKMKYLK